jgi:hypothetical protein
VERCPALRGARPHNGDESRRKGWLDIRGWAKYPVFDTILKALFYHSNCKDPGQYELNVARF